MNKFIFYEIEVWKWTKFIYSLINLLKKIYKFIHYSQFYSFIDKCVSKYIINVSILKFKIAEKYKFTK